MKKHVAVVGATGIAGQQYLVALSGHPWFEVVTLAASERSAGKPYREALRDPHTGARRWWCVEEPPAALLDLPVAHAEELDMGLVVTLKPLLDRFGVQRVLMTSMQGISGAGRSPGVSALDIVDNVIPYIPGEEEKVARETGKILGRLRDGGIRPASFPVSATCTRAAVSEGHTEAVAVSLEAAATPAEVAAALAEFGGELTRLGLPSAPRRLITVHDDPFRPQPRLDRDADGGMTTSVGRIREDRALEHGVKYVLVSHNTKLGAAKGAVLTAEALVTDGHV